MNETSCAHDVLGAAGYHLLDTPSIHGHRRWLRRTDGVLLAAHERLPVLGVPETRYLIEATRYNFVEAGSVLLRSYSAATLAADLADLEKRALAALQVLTEEREP